MKTKTRIKALEAAAIAGNQAARNEAGCQWLEILWSALPNIEPGGINPNTGMRSVHAISREDRIISMGDRINRDAMTDADRDLLAAMLDAEAETPEITLRDYVLAMAKICAMM